MSHRLCAFGVCVCARAHARRPLPLVTEDGSQKEKKEGAGGEKKKETDVTPVTRLRQEQSVYVDPTQDTSKFMQL